jgi:FtsP/CotA-like multicopper oxidase with cupredoxin domain
MHLHGHFFKVLILAAARALGTKGYHHRGPHAARCYRIHGRQPGNGFHHCHNLYHMEAGMANVVVYQP